MFTQSMLSPIGNLIIDATNEKITSIQFSREDISIKKGNWLTKECIAQLRQYFSKARKDFDLPYELNGTPFQNAVWQELLSIKYGSTCSYSDVAIALGHPNAQRAVGSANRLNSLPLIIPCHRVLGKGGKLAGYASGTDKKAWLLRLEGADFI